jgi:hypothetical protein
LAIKEKHMTPKKTKVLIPIALFISGLVIPIANAQQKSGPVKAVHVTGLAKVKDNVTGTLDAANGQLHFAYGEDSSDISITSIQDVITGADNQAALGKTAYVLSIAAPYGSGRFLCLFRKKIDTLTIQYRDADGGLHGVIFSMSNGTADVIRNELVGQGAHITAMGKRHADHDPSSTSSSEVIKQ